MVNNPPANTGDIRDVGLIPRSGKSPGGGHGNPLQYSCLENPMGRGAWGLQFMGSQRVGQDRSNLTCMHAGGSFISSANIIEHLLGTRHCSKSFSSKVVNRTVQNPKHNEACIPNENK